MHLIIKAHMFPLSELIEVHDLGVAQVSEVQLTSVTESHAFLQPVVLTRNKEIALVFFIYFKRVNHFFVL